MGAPVLGMQEGVAVSINCGISGSLGLGEGGRRGSCASGEGSGARPDGAPADHRQHSSERAPAPATQHHSRSDGHLQWGEVIGDVRVRSPVQIRMKVTFSHVLLCHFRMKTFFMNEMCFVFFAYLHENIT